MQLDPAYVKTIELIFKKVWSEKTGPVVKANKDALALSSDLLTLFVVEAVNRAAQVAKTEDSGTIEFSHIEKILPQLLLDF